MSPGSWPTSPRPPTLQHWPLGVAGAVGGGQRVPGPGFHPCPLRELPVMLTGCGTAAKYCCL